MGDFCRCKNSSDSFNCKKPVSIKSLIKNKSITKKAIVWWIIKRKQPLKRSPLNMSFSKVDRSFGWHDPRSSILIILKRENLLHITNKVSYKGPSNDSNLLFYLTLSTHLFYRIFFTAAHEIRAKAHDKY